MINTYRKGLNVQLSPHFNLSEFSCPCINISCQDTKIDSDLISKLEIFRSLVQAPIRINSGYRCGDYQAELRLRGYETSIGPSEHEVGRAADVMREDSQSSGTQLEVLARQAGFESIGVASSWIHCDLRPGYRRWTYEKR